MSAPCARRALVPRLALVVATTVLLAACNDTGDGPDDGTPSRASWSAAEDSVDTSGLVWAAGGTVHLGDGSTIDTGLSIRSFVVAQGGVYVVPDDASGTDTDETATGEQQLAELQRVTAEGTEPLGVRPEPDSLEVSPDGRHLAFLDRGDRSDGYGTPVAEAVVVDLETGEEVARSADGMGDPRSDDLADLYEELPPEVIGVDDQHAYVETTDDIRSIELSSGEVEVVGEPGDARDAPWYDAVTTELVAASPDGAWSIRLRTDDVPLLVAKHGTTVATRLTARDVGIGSLDPQPRSLSWSLDSWLDDTTAVGTARVSASVDGSETWVLITCSVPEGACAAVPGTEDGALVPEDRRDGVLVPDPARFGSQTNG